MVQRVAGRAVRGAASAAGGSFGATMAEEFLRRVVPVLSSHAEEFIHSQAWQDMLGALRAQAAGPAIQQPIDTPFMILGVSMDDPQEVVAAVYRAKVSYWHPDKRTGNAERFKGYTEAYHAVLRARGWKAK